MTAIELPLVKGAVEKEKGVFIVPKGTKAEIGARLSGGEAKLRLILEENSSLSFRSETTGDSSLTVDCALAGAHASVNIINVCRAEEKASQKSVTNVLHSAPHTRSLVSSRGVAWDSATVDLSGLAKVENTAPGTVSRVECKALVLGDGAKARADPLLEILNNDVDCSHAASVSELDRDKIFYLQTRGLSEEKAKQMIVDGFLGEESPD
jgi:Fe-S cluster assembly scaffold protein SufB